MPFLLNPQSPEQFDAFVKRIENQASRHPKYYRLRLRILAILGYVYIIFIFTLLCSLLFSLRYFLVRNGMGAASSIDPIIVIIGLGIIRLFLTYIPAPKGIAIKRSQAPVLFREIDRFSQSLNAPRFHNVLLTDDLNAAVAQRPRFGIIGWTKNYLLLGLPLMQVLSPKQFQAVMVHELGHLAGNDGRFSSWIYQVRRVWFDLAEQFELTHQGGWLFGRFFQWYGPFFKAYSFVLARANEYEADRAAAKWVGVKPKAEALLQLRIYSHFLYASIWPSVYKQTDGLAHPPNHTITGVLNRLKRGPSIEDARSTIELALMNTTNNDDTHPCLSDRLQALDYEVDLDALPTTPTQTAANYFLGTELEQWMDQLDLAWVEENQKDWNFRHRIRQQQHQCLERLEQKVIAGDVSHDQVSTFMPVLPLTVEEMWQRAYLTWLLQDARRAIPLFQEVLARSPQHPHANFYFGKLLVEQENWTGIFHLEQAMANHPAFVIPGAELLYEVHQSLQQFTKAEFYRQRRQQHQALWAGTTDQSAKLRLNDHYEYHALPSDERQQIAEYLRQCDEVQIAYLVKKLSLPPNIPSTEQSSVNPPIYILGIVRRFIAGRGADHLNNIAFAKWLKAGLCFSADLEIVVFTHPSMPLCRAIQQVEASRLCVNL
ncbi:MAG: M48 family metallopeptidase [Cyanobacteria bacterium P01_F01_bin.150]